MVEAEGAISLLASVTVNVEKTLRAPKQAELAISRAMTAEPIVRSEL